MLLAAGVALCAGVIGVALALTGIGIGHQSGATALPLLTEASRAGGPTTACYLSFATGRLVLDARYGTAIVEEAKVTPVMWPTGYRARAARGELEVLNSSGVVVAATGTTVRVWGGYEGVSPGYFLACSQPGSRPSLIPDP